MLSVLAAMMLAATAGAALAVDIGRAYALKSDLQGAADAAALAAAVMLPDLEAARKAASRAVRMNLPNHQDLLRTNDFEFGSWHAPSGSIVEDNGVASAVRVTVQRTASRGNGLDALFAGIFGEGQMDIAASAAAGKRGVACMIALDPKGKGLKLNGKATLELAGCGAQINAGGKDALSIRAPRKLVEFGTPQIFGRAIVLALRQHTSLDPLILAVKREFPTDSACERRQVAAAASRSSWGRRRML